jgi:hypothetical protein
LDTGLRKAYVHHFTVEGDLIENTFEIPENFNDMFIGMLENEANFLEGWSTGATTYENLAYFNFLTYFATPMISEFENIEITWSSGEINFSYDFYWEGVPATDDFPGVPGSSGSFQVKYYNIQLNPDLPDSIFQLPTS